MFGLSSFYYSIWFVIGLLQRGAVRRFIVSLYLCGDDSNKQNGFDQLKISNYSHQYVEGRFYSHYIIKFLGFMSIYYVINLYIVSSYIVFSYLYLCSIDILQV